MKTFSYDNILDGEIHTLDFKVKKETDEKTKQLLFESVHTGKFRLPTHMMPSELWAAARNLSQTYDKLNEVINCRNEWHILGLANAEDALSARTSIKKLKTPYVLIESTTYSQNKPLLICQDTVLLLHNTQYQFKEPPIEKSTGEKIGEVEIYFRYEWNEKKWKNNIHTNYATTLGYKEEIPEFINYMDCIYAFTGSSNIQIKKLLPLYQGDKIDLMRTENELIFSRHGEVRLKAKIDRLTNPSTNICTH
ncbi:MAG: hypothetical protein ACP5N2_00590 [Candidatus Nanoarchaeia archaeon]